MNKLAVLPRFFPRQSAGVALCFLPLLLGLSCGRSQSPTAPGMPELAGFALTLMSPVAAGQPIDLKIEALGTDGSRPYAGFSGPVTLSVDRGTVTPGEVTLTDGVTTTAVQLSVADGAVEISATAGTASGKTTIALTALSILPGSPGDPVETAIPDLAFEPRGIDYDTNHPEIPGIPISYNTIGIVFELGATVGQANTILTNLGATIAGGIPGVAGQAPGLLMIRTNSTSHATMAAYLQDLEANPLVRVAIEDWQAAVAEQPQENGGYPSDWKWEVEPAGGNWGLELARMPAVWNLNPSIERLSTPSIAMGVIDAGMAAHVDFPPFVDLTPGQVDDHGLHVAGIMGTLYDNGLGVDGVNPYANFVTMGEDTLSDLWQTSALHQIMKQNPQTKVVNVSIGYEWCEGMTNPGMSAASQKHVRAVGLLCSITLGTLRALGRAPLMCVSAGNESDCGLGPVQAIWSSCWANAALEHMTPEILVVENVRREAGSPGGATRASDSNIGGHLSAPGTSIRSTVRGSYELKSGTSMASPFVAGFIGYLYALVPSLTQDEIKDEIKQLLVDTATPVGGGAADRIDAAAAVLTLDTIRGDEILRRFVDIDDGTPDGNQRAFFGNPGVDFLDDDVDGNGGPGDGQIDMADFRRWRDWLLQAEDVTLWELDGTTRHPKRDVNGNGTVETPEDENVWPRGDFNLDGILSRTAKSRMPGAMEDVEATDLEVLQSLFQDPHVTAGELLGLIESGDVQVDLSSFLGQQDVTSARMQVVDGITQVLLAERTLASASQPAIVTVATGLSLYAVRVQGLDVAGAVICTAETDFELAPGKDIYYTPECSNVVVEALLAAEIEPGTPSPLLVRAGTKTGATVTYQAGMQIAVTATGGSVAPADGATAADGYFSAEVTMQEGAEVTTVFVTATDPGTGQSATTSASARALVVPPPVVLRYNKAAIAAGASTPGSSPNQEIVRENVPFYSESLEFSSQWTCGDNPDKKGVASSSSEMEYEMAFVPMSDHVKSFDLSGSMSVSGEAAVDGDGCGGVFQIGAGATGGKWVDLEVLDEAGVMDVQLQGTLQGRSYNLQVEVLEAEEAHFSNARRVLQVDYQDENRGPGEFEVAEAVELQPGHFYRLQVNVGTGDSNFNQSTTFANDVNFQLHVRLKKSTMPRQAVLSLPPMR